MNERIDPEARPAIKPPVLFGALLGSILITKAFALPSPVPRQARAAGIPLLFLGLLLGGSAVAAQFRAGTSPDMRQPTTALVTSGPYRFTRNPIYLGMAMMISGLAVLMNTIWTLLLVPGMIMILDREVVQREEGYLETQFGKPYQEYLLRVPRWL